MGGRALRSRIGGHDRKMSDRKMGERATEGVRKENGRKATTIHTN